MKGEWELWDRRKWEQGVGLGARVYMHMKTSGRLVDGAFPLPP